MDDCDICLKRIGGHKERARLQCGHNQFHRDCLMQWLGVSRTCPLCKAPVEHMDAGGEGQGMAQCRASRRQRRIKMSAGLGRVSQLEEDLALAAELSMIDAQAVYSRTDK